MNRFIEDLKESLEIKKLFHRVINIKETWNHVLSEFKKPRRIWSSEIKEFWNRVRESLFFIIENPKSTRDELDECLSFSYREVILGWLYEITLPGRLLFKLCVQLIFFCFVLKSSINAVLSSFPIF